MSVWLRLHALALGEALARLLRQPFGSGLAILVLGIAIALPVVVAVALRSVGAAAAGLDPNKDVEWVMIAPEVQGLALDNGQVDALANSEPLGSILLSMDKVRTIADQAMDPPYRDEYCCVTVVSGQLARSDPAAAAKLTRAILKAAAWVDQNPMAAAKLSVEKKYIAASEEINAHAISKLQYRPSVKQCRDSIDQEIVATASAQLDPLLLPAHRVQLAARIKQLYDEKNRLKTEIPQLEAELRIRTQELEAVHQSMAAVSF